MGQTPTPSPTFSAFWLSVIDALRTLQHFTFKVRLSKSLHQVMLADLPYLRGMETASTTGTSCDQPSFFCVSTPQSDGMTIPQKHTDYEPNSELDMARRFVGVLDLNTSSNDPLDIKRLIHEQRSSLQPPSLSEHFPYHSVPFTFDPIPAQCT